MFIWPGSDIHKGWARFFCLCWSLPSWWLPPKAEPCSCEWRGPFLTVVVEAPLVVHPRVFRHQPGPNPTMDVLVLEVLSGGLLDSGLRVQMGDGIRGTGMEGFPVGSEWILALNGPGARPGKGLALSHCGEYWLRVRGDEAVGNFDGAQGEQKRKPLSELRLRLRFPKSKQKSRAGLRRGPVSSRPSVPDFNSFWSPGRPAGKL